jgi:hypothetical protein
VVKVIASIALATASFGLLAGPAGAAIEAKQPIPEKMQAWASRQHVLDKIAELDEIYNAEIVSFYAVMDTSDIGKRGSKNVDKVGGSLAHSPDKSLNKLMNKALDKVGDLFDSYFFDVQPWDPEAVVKAHRVAVAWADVKARLVSYGVAGPDAQWRLLGSSYLPDGVAGPSAPSATPPPPPTNLPSISLAEFDAIQTGWTLQMVIDTVGGAGQQLSHFELSGFVSDIYMWDGEGGFGANANVELQNGRVIGKAQFGLS